MSQPTNLIIAELKKKVALPTPPKPIAPSKSPTSTKPVAPALPVPPVVPAVKKTAVALPLPPVPALPLTPAPVAGQNASNAKIENKNKVQNMVKEHDKVKEQDKIKPQNKAKEQDKAKAQNKVKSESKSDKKNNTEKNAPKTVKTPPPPIKPKPIIKGDLNILITSSANVTGAKSPITSPITSPSISPAMSPTTSPRMSPFSLSPPQSPNLSPNSSPKLSPEFTKRNLRDQRKNRLSNPDIIINKVDADEEFVALKGSGPNSPELNSKMIKSNKINSKNKPSVKFSNKVKLIRFEKYKPEMVGNSLPDAANKVTPHCLEFISAIYEKTKMEQLLEEIANHPDIKLARADVNSMKHEKDKEKEKIKEEITRTVSELTRVTPGNKKDPILFQKKQTMYSVKEAEEIAEANYLEMTTNSIGKSFNQSIGRSFKSFNKEKQEQTIVKSILKFNNIVSELKPILFAFMSDNQKAARRASINEVAGGKAKAIKDEIESRYRSNSNVNGNANGNNNSNGTANNNISNGNRRKSETDFTL